MADYLNQEAVSSDAAMDYRRQALRTYAALVSDASEFPLQRFRSRTDPVTKAVGYDKSAMVFHTLRQEVGDAPFWDALRSLYDRCRFRPAARQDLQAVFESRAGRSLAEFFAQWIERPGAPRLRLEGVRRLHGSPRGYRTVGFEETMTLRTARCIAATLLTLILVTAAGGRGHQQPSDRLSLYDVAARQTLPPDEVAHALRRNRLVLVGEHHTDPAHHAAQPAVLRLLDERTVPLAIGLEMFRKDQQEALDRWVAGKTDEAAFREVYLDNWNFPWPLYREIFVYARDNRIPMVGLNVSRGLTQQVARHGFASLSDDQRGELEGVTCTVTREYRDFIRRAFGAHGHGSMDFIHSCEAQLVWDTAMAIHALAHLDAHPERTMVLLAGSGHARKMGIPHQVRDRSPVPHAVLLPHTPGIFDPDTLTADDADYIVMP